MEKQKTFEVIEESRFLKRGKLGYTLGQGAELCSKPRFDSCAPYSVPCLINFMCGEEYIIRPCVGRQQSCTEVSVLCNANYTMCIDKAYIVGP